MLVRYQPLRQLNDNRGHFGLEGADLGVGVAVFVVLSLVLDGSPYAILAVPGAILSLLCLVPVRLMTRRRILRDWVAYFLSSRVIAVQHRRQS